MREVRTETLHITRLESVLPADRLTSFEKVTAAARERLSGRIVWNINSTATGGGVAEMLQTLLGYAKGGGVDARWLVIRGDAQFFAITKRLHNVLHGEPGDGGGFGPSEREHYEQVIAANLDGLRERVSPRDIVLVHDPQPAGLLPALRAWNIPAVWRCHIGRDTSNEYTTAGWDFLRPYVESADRFIFSRPRYRPDWVDSDRTHVIPPSIDPFAMKNRELSADEAARILDLAGLVQGRTPAEPMPFTRPDGSTGVVRRHVGVLQGGEDPPPPNARLVVQISRWDRLKDMPGVLAGFVDHVLPREGTHLVLAGPAVAGVGDDPEGAQVLAECLDDWKQLPDAIRRRVHLACVPMVDPDENALIINALQRRAAVVVQKSLVEGFGLTVSEAMWKARPVVASAVGGIRDQIVPGRDGLLLDDPGDRAEFGRSVRRVLDDPSLAERLGAAARARVLAEYLGDRHLRQYAEVLADLPGPAGA